MRFNFAFALVVFVLLLGCIANPKAIRDFYKTQARLEAKVDKISQAIEAMKLEQKEREERLTRIEQSIEQNYLELRERVNNLEKRKALQVSPQATSPDALYKIAESYYREGKFTKAILAFQRFIDAYPKDKRVPTSYLMQGNSLINIGRKEEAKFFFQTLIDKFPESEEAKIAKEKLKEIKEKN